MISIQIDIGIRRIKIIPSMAGITVFNCTLFSIRLNPCQTLVHIILVVLNYNTILIKNRICIFSKTIKTTARVTGAMAHHAGIICREANHRNSYFFILVKSSSIPVQQRLIIIILKQNIRRKSAGMNMHILRYYRSTIKGDY